MSVAPNLDLRPDHWAIVRDALRRHVPDREVLAFGSRATWTAKDYSDLDLAIMGEEPLSLRASSALDEALVDSDLPFRVDIVDWARIDDSFREIIRRNGVVLQGWGQRPEADGCETTTPGRSEKLAEWTRTTLGELLSFSNGKSSPDRSDLLPHPVYGSNGVIGFADKSNAGPSTIIIGRVGTYCGSLHYSDSACWVTDNAIRASAIGRNKPSFLRYLLRTLRLNARRTGSGQPLLNQTILSEIPVVVPNPPEQRAIAHVLGTLDEKIELNRRMNETLEAMARALFKSWFVDFDPVRAKMEGRDTGLPLGIADLFPDKLVGSEMGEIPEGWKVGRVSDVCMRIENGGTPKRAIRKYWNGDIKWFKTSELVDEPLLESSERITDLGLRKSSCKRWPAGTVLIALYASPTVGRLGILEVPAAANQACCGLVSAPDYGKLFLYYTLLFGRPFFQNIAVGAAQQNISQRIVRDYKIVIPRRDISSAFDNMAEVLYLQRVSRQSESRVLSAIRDTLLPKLVSGEIRVPDAERAMESIT